MNLPVVVAFLIFFHRNFILAQDSRTGGGIPLVQKRFKWPNLPYQADTGDGERGKQSGYNICNATTQNQQSNCQTIFLNNISDFCLWGAQKPNSVVGDVEGDMVGFCSTKAHGARLLTAGSITGLQLTRTPSYIQVVGYIDQTTLNVKKDDDGGELDPHGEDLRGNPLGGLVYSNAFKNPEGAEFSQVIEWNMFIGSGEFCFKACDPAAPNAASLCENKYDRTGCEYNMPANYQKIRGKFEACKGDDQLPVGVYVENGATKTWQQPPESLGPIKNIPYQPMTPASSDCVSYASATLFPELVPPSRQTPMSNAPKKENQSSASGNNSPSRLGDPFPAATGRPAAADATVLLPQAMTRIILATLIWVAVGAWMIACR